MSQKELNKFSKNIQDVNKALNQVESMTEVNANETIQNINDTLGLTLQYNPNKNFMEQQQDFEKRIENRKYYV